MKKDKVIVHSRSLSFASILTIVFIVLKLCHVIEWSWIWVISPLWISLIIGIFIFISIFLYFLSQEY